MGLGWKLFRQALRLVLGNLLKAAQLSVLLTAIPLAALFFMSTRISATMPPTSGETVTIDILSFAGLGFIGTLLLFLVCTVWIAVGWHRFILLEEAPESLWPKFHGDQFRVYIWRFFQLFLIAMVGFFILGMPATLLITSLLTVQQSATILAFHLALNIAVSILLGLLMARVSLVLPAAAIGQTMGISESWEETKGTLGALVTLVGIMAVSYTAVDVLLGLIFPVGLVGFLAWFVVTWFLSILSLAIVTVLYGYLVEGRPID